MYIIIIIYIYILCILYTLHIYTKLHCVSVQGQTCYERFSEGLLPQQVVPSISTDELQRFVSGFLWGEGQVGSLVAGKSAHHPLCIEDS